MESSYKKGLVDSGKSCGVLVVSPLIAVMHAYAGVFTPTSGPTHSQTSHDIIITFKLNACANSVYQAFPPAIEGLGTRLKVLIIGKTLDSIYSELEPMGSHGIISRGWEGARRERGRGNGGRE